MRMPLSRSGARAASMHFVYVQGDGQKEEPNIGRLRTQKHTAGTSCVVGEFLHEICILEIDCDEPIFVLDLRHTHLELVFSKRVVQTAKI